MMATDGGGDSSFWVVFQFLQPHFVRIILHSDRHEEQSFLRFCTSQRNSFMEFLRGIYHIGKGHGGAIARWCSTVMYQVPVGIP